MEVNQIIEQYSEIVDGKCSSYDNTKSVVVVPVSSHRYQSMLAQIQTVNEQPYIEVSTKICTEEHIPEKLFHLEKQMTFGKLIVRDGYLQVICYFTSSTPVELVTEMINEIASFADIQEKKISGQDVY